MYMLSNLLLTFGQRITIRRPPSRLCDGTCAIGLNLRNNRLDNTAHSHKRQIERSTVLYRRNEPLLWFNRTSCRLLVPVRLCFRRLVRFMKPITLPSDHPLVPRDVRFWNHHWRHYTSCHSLSLPEVNYHARSQTPHQSAIHDRFLYHLHILSPFTLSRYP